MKRLGGGRDGDNEHRDTYATFETALRASRLDLDSDQLAKVRSVIAEVTRLEGRPPDHDGFTVQTSGGELRVVWGIGQIVVHPGFIVCRHALKGFGPRDEKGWHERAFANRAGGSGRGEPKVPTWTCQCFLIHGIGMDSCDVCGAERPA
jgi:hypothetical protein